MLKIHCGYLAVFENCQRVHIVALNNDIGAEFYKATQLKNNRAIHHPNPSKPGPASPPQGFLSLPLPSQLDMLMLIAIRRLASAAVIVPALYSLNAETRREAVDISSYPWSSIGKVNAAGQCTGVVIGPRQFLTAAHCLYNVAAGRFISAGSVHFLLGYVRWHYRMETTAARYTISPTFDPQTDTDDWAVLYVNDAFPTTPLRLATEPPQPGLLVKAAGYNQGRLHVMTADQRCQIRSVSGTMLSHDCVILHGDSGGPLLDANGALIGINVAVSPFLPVGFAVSAASINESLSSQVASKGFSLKKAGL